MDAHPLVPHPSSADLNALASRMYASAVYPKRDRAERRQAQVTGAKEIAEKRRRSGVKQRRRF